MKKMQRRGKVDKDGKKTKDGGDKSKSSDGKESFEGKIKSLPFLGIEGVLRNYIENNNTRTCLTQTKIQINQFINKNWKNTLENLILF